MQIYTIVLKTIAKYSDKKDTKLMESIMKNQSDSGPDKKNKTIYN